MSQPFFFGSECAFTNLFVWRGCYNIYWTTFHDFLIIKVNKNDVDFFLQPFGGCSDNLPELIEALKEYNNNQPFEFHGMYECSVERFKKVYPNLEVVEDRDNWDYVYLRENLANIAGRKYHGQKNHYNSFKKNYPDYVFEEITPNIYSECLEFGENWCEKRIDNDPSLECELCAMREAFVNFERLGLRGGAIRINGKIEAFSFGKKINDEVAVIHVEKANPEFKGIYAAINKETAMNIWTDVKYLNREEDMGVEGLRRAKESYHPEFLVKKYNVFF